MSTVVPTGTQEFHVFNMVCALTLPGQYQIMKAVVRVRQVSDHRRNPRLITLRSSLRWREERCVINRGFRRWFRISCRNLCLYNLNH